VLDVMFLLDGSGSSTQKDFDYTLDFVKDFAALVDLNQIHIGVMQYSHWFNSRYLNYSS